MAIQHTFVQNYQEFLGVDLKSSDIVRPRNFASGGQNINFRAKNEIEKRSGFQYKAPDTAGLGMVTYSRVNPTTGLDEPEIVAFDDKAYKLMFSTFTITYSGLFDDVQFSLFLDEGTNTFKAQIEENGESKLNLDLGKGFDEGSPVTLAGLKTSIDLITNFSMTIAGDDSVPAAFAEITRGNLISPSGGTTTINYSYFQEINSPSSSPLAGSLANLGSDEFENVSATNLNNVLYVCNGYDEMHKYDGQTFYRAGMPQPDAPSVATGGAGVLNSTYRYGQTYIQIDAAGQVVEGKISENSSNVSPSSQSVDVTVDNITSSSGFNTNCAIVAGAQGPVTTINVDDGSGGSHTMKAGDTAYFFDSVTGDYITREVTSVAAGTITIAGAGVTVADNAVISNNLRIALYRNVAGGTERFFLVEIPNNSFSATQVYNDNLSDGSLGDIYIVPFNSRDLPPKGKYITTFRNGLIVSGQLTNTSRVFFSDSDGPEFFPAASHAFDVGTGIGDKVTGLSPNNDQLLVFKANSIFTVSGDLPELNFRVDQLTSGDLGCESHHSIKEVREGVIYFLTSRGPYQIVGGQLPTPVGPTQSSTGQLFSRIEPFFTEAGLLDADARPRLKRAVGINFEKDAKYLLFIPAEDSSNTTSDSNSNGTTWVFDYSRGAWLPQWKQINAAGGFAVLNDTLYWNERSFSSFDYASRSKLAQYLQTNDEYDYADHTEAITSEYPTHWEHVGEPSIFKKFLWLKIYAIGEARSATWTLRIQTELDFRPDLLSTNSELIFGATEDSTGYGADPWGLFPWGNPIEEGLKMKLKTDKARSMRITFSNNQLHKNFLITGWELEGAAPYRQIKG